MLSYVIVFFVFFFQAEDGIRDWSVTGVQTCARFLCRIRCRGSVRLLSHMRARANVGRWVRDRASRMCRTRGPCGCTPQSGVEMPPQDTTRGGWPRVYIALSLTQPPRPVLCTHPIPRVNGPHDSDLSTAPRVDPERLDGLSTRAAGEGPRGVG